MYDLEYSGQFKKDLKLMNKRGVNLNDLRKVLDYLIIEGQVPISFKPHILSGKTVCSSVSALNFCPRVR